MIDLAVRRDLPVLTTLWQTCFGDDVQSIRTFWDALFDDIQVFVARENGTPVSMLCALSTSLVNKDNKRFPAAYLYAVCTAPTARGRGYCRSLMSFAEDALHRAGICFTALVPSNDRLFQFYERLGYEAVFYHNTYSVPAVPHEGSIALLHPEAYRIMRESKLSGSFLSYDTTLLQWQETCGRQSGAGLYRIETGDSICCAAAEKDGNTLLLKELLPNDPNAAAFLASRLNCTHSIVRTEGKDKPFGMIKTLCGLPASQYAYLGLAFD